MIAAGVGGLGTIAVTGLIAWFVPSLRRVPPLHQIQLDPEELEEKPI